MMISPITRVAFEDLSNRILGQLEPGEELNLSLSSEASQFVRFNGPRVRQAGRVDDASLEITLFLKSEDGYRRATAARTLTGLSYDDRRLTADALQDLRGMIRELAMDPHAVPPQGGQSSTRETAAKLLPEESATDTLIQGIGESDISGIYSAGPVVRAMANSAGLRHWFSTEGWNFDYSIYTPEQRAVKATVAGLDWDASAFDRSIAHSKAQLAALSRPAVRLARGDYRVWLAPAATGELLGLLAYGTFGEQNIRQGDSAILKIREGRAGFSDKFSLREDFSYGDVPRFNDQGELSPEKLPLVEDGAMKNTLINQRTAREYGLVPNGANRYEGLTSPVISGGDLDDADILARLGDGIFVSNLHYLNWSDIPGGRITGMTRYACFHVQAGKIVAPIENMRFDEGLFSIFGDSLEAVGRRLELQPEVMTYFMRHLGGARCPGLLLSRFKFTI